MKKRAVSMFAFLAYIAILIKVMVFKAVPTIHLGQLMLNFGGTDTGHGPNFIPFATIGPYLLGYKGWIIAGINLIGNVALLIPLGFLLPLIYPNMTWKKSILLGILSGLVIEVLQVILHVGIFDIDDVILNALGFVVGYGIFVLLKSMKLRNAIITTIVTATVIVSLGFFTYKNIIRDVEENGPQNSSLPQAHDLCGGTRGTGEIVEKGSNTITIKRNDGVLQTMIIGDKTTIKKSSGPTTMSDLKVGDRVTIVIEDGKTAVAVFVCSN